MTAEHKTAYIILLAELCLGFKLNTRCYANMRNRLLTNSHSTDSIEMDLDVAVLQYS